MEALKEIGNILVWLNTYKEATNCKGVVLGISGGKDSTVVAMLAKKIWGDNVFGVMMPNGDQKDIHDSFDIVRMLKLKHCVVDIDHAFAAICSDIQGGIGQNVSDKALTNVPPRLRMTTLYAIAQTLGYRVIGTGNLSEAYVGWTTKWGDSAYDFNPIAHLTCTEVMEIGKILAEDFGLDPKFVTKTPSDGLSGKSDEDNFGFTYKDLDNYIRADSDKVDMFFPAELIDKIAEMHENSIHKREKPLTML